MYVVARVYSIATLWQSLKAIGAELSDFFSGSTASSRDTDVPYRRLHARNLLEGCFKVWKQSVQKFRSYDRSYKQTYPFLYTECPQYKYIKINAYIFVPKRLMKFIFLALYRVTQKVFNARQYTSMWAPVIA
jgi:hypothetical protein